MPLLEKPFHRYDLDVEIPETEVAVLVDALEGERLSLKTKLGWETLKEQITEEQHIFIEVLSDDAWSDFENDIRTLSVYLSEPISGREVYAEPGEHEPFLQGWLVLGRRGESARIPLLLKWDDDANALVDGGVDRENLDPKWENLPAWVKDALGPQLRTEQAQG